MTTLVYETADEGPGPILLDHTSELDYVIVGAYGYAELLPAFCACRSGTECSHGSGYAHANFTWSQSEPLVFTVELLAKGERQSWVFGRQVLFDGGGDADVQVQRGGEKAEVRLSTPDGAARLLFDQAWLDLLIETTEDIVPMGEEISEIDWDAALERLL